MFDVQFAEQLRQLRSATGFVVGDRSPAIAYSDYATFKGASAHLEVPLDSAQLDSVLGGARVTSVRADVEPVKPFAMMPATPDYSRPDQGVFDGMEVAGSAFVPPAPPEGPAALIHYDATQDPAYYHQAPPALSGPPAVTLRELVDTLGMHPGGSALIHQIHQVCGALPGNVGLLQELSQYVNQPPGQHIPGYMLGGGVVGAGDVTGPGASTDNAIARYDGTTGKVIQNSGVWLNDAGQLQTDHASPIPTYSFQSPHDMSGMAWDADVGEGPALKDTNGDTQLRITTAGVEIDNDLTVGDLTANSLDLTTPLPITEGGTGADNAPSARTNLGLEIGTDVYTQRTILGNTFAVGTLLTTVNVTNGDGVAGNPTIEAQLSGEMPVANGGTGASTASGARTNLGLGSLATLNTVGTSQIDNDSVTDAKLRNSAALSVIGRSANSIGDPADIAAGSDHQVLRRSGSAIGFGAVNLASSAAVTGALPVANGGTGATDAATARTNLGVQSSVLSVMTSNLNISTSMQTTVLGGAVENGGWYAVEGLLLLTTSNTVGVRVDFDNGSCTLDSITYSVIKNSAGTLTAAAPNTSRSTDTTINAATVTNCMFWFKGYFKVDASGAGNLFMRADRVSASGTQTLLAGSWMRFTKLA
ncbi:MAG: hypothetical protein IPK87_10580 [Planctomycetes bacterium]|nr:hypothetical protein [Planctomycetota bacterium]